MKKVFYIFITFTVIWGSVYAQSPQFSQFYANQVYLNPAFTGNTKVNRLAANYRNQWAGVPGAFHSYSLAFDHNLDLYNVGLGLLAIRDQAGSGGLSYTSFAALAAYKFQLTENLSVNAGMSYGWAMRAANTSKYVFGDQLVNGGNTTANINTQRSYGDLGSGFLLYNERFWGGMSALHLNRPNESLVLGQESRVPVVWSMHGGYVIPTKQTEKGDILKSIILASNYKFSKRADQLDFGFYYVPNRLILGAWYRGLTLFKKNADNSPSNDAFIVLVGLKFDGFRIGYSYDITSSKLKVSESYGSHEISMTLEWPTHERKKKRRKRKFIAPCPKF